MFNRSNLAKATNSTTTLDKSSSNLFRSHHYYCFVANILLLILSFVNFSIASSASGLSPSDLLSFRPFESVERGRDDNSIFESYLNSTLAHSGREKENGDIKNDDDDDEAEDDLDLNKLVELRGFSLETHQVTTRDGYILTIHRLINPWLEKSSGKTTNSGTPVILQHGILCASPFFFINSSPERDRPQLHNETLASNSLAFELSRRGFDVWLPNFRGTQFSRKHLRLNSARDRSYWNFNVDSLVEHDLSAYVRYILHLTGAQRYVFVGHSLGATVGLGSLLVHGDGAGAQVTGGGASSDREITRQLSCSILMAPVASTQYMRGRLMSLFQTATLLYREPGPFPGQVRTFSAFIRRICPRLRQLCIWMASMFIGTKERTPFTSTSAPVGGSNDGEFEKQVCTFLMMLRQSVSVQMLQHIVQVHSSGRLSRFNYGPRRNLLHYGSTLAPIYDLTKISQPQLKLAIVSGQSDAISTRGEVSWISEQIRDKVGHFEQITVPVSPFNHMDLIMSSEAGTLVNKQMLDFLDRNECL